MSPAQQILDIYGESLRTRPGIISLAADEQDGTPVIRVMVENILRYGLDLPRSLGGDDHGTGSVLLIVDRPAYVEAAKPEEEALVASS